MLVCTSFDVPNACLCFQPEPKSVPYKIALHNHKVLVSSTESRDTLAQQVSSRRIWFSSSCSNNNNNNNSNNNNNNNSNEKKKEKKKKRK